MSISCGACRNCRTRTRQRKQANRTSWCRARYPKTRSLTINSTTRTTSKHRQENNRIAQPTRSPPYQASTRTTSATLKFPRCSHGSSINQLIMRLRLLTLMNLLEPATTLASVRVKARRITRCQRVLNQVPIKEITLLTILKAIRRVEQGPSPISSCQASHRPSTNDQISKSSNSRRPIRTRRHTEKVT